ncbi:MAG: hypothetical protein P4M12_11655 [Gammaproteobacteria bacterium]|nr:hypothetical protein [Gammaproteobacteria bacterium]
MALSDEYDVHNLLTVGVLEIIADSKKVSKIAKRKLTGEALNNFNLIEEYWHGKNIE